MLQSITDATRKKDEAAQGRTALQAENDCLAAEKAELKRQVAELTAERDRAIHECRQSSKAMTECQAECERKLAEARLEMATQTGTFFAECGRTIQANQQQWMQQFAEYRAEREKLERENAEMAANMSAFRSKMVAEEASPASTPHRVLAMYKFTPLSKDGLKELQQELERELRKFGTRGTLLVATEGINGTICYPFPPSAEKDPVYEYLQGKFGKKLRTRISSYDKAVFARLKIKLKSEIVTMHQDDVHPTESVGTYVGPEKWNDLLNDPDCMVIDTRNEYEIDVGTFENAINPHTKSFVEFPDWMKSTSFSCLI